MLTALASLTVIGLILGSILGLAARYLKVEGNPMIEKIVELLPGAQCGQCGYPGCAPAAEAIAGGHAKVTICTPGGRAVAESLASLVCPTECIEMRPLTATVQTWYWPLPGALAA